MSWSWDFLKIILAKSVGKRRQSLTNHFWQTSQRKLLKVAAVPMTWSSAQDLVVVFGSCFDCRFLFEFLVFQKLNLLRSSCLAKILWNHRKSSLSYGHFLVWHSQERRSFQKLGCPQNSALYLGTGEAADQSTKPWYVSQNNGVISMSHRRMENSNSEFFGIWMRAAFFFKEILTRPWVR